ncbi:RsmD family RNA methyltransferase [Pseudobacteriovorax antillogorgiicola]|uniref:16S rRNA (Guanine(966)-N(2))-methyltransferase RsmD n=1 Tax=Pseudobacteriovorax antillogorgiicola TaxID=1513793 RepID=A0A1Y6BCU1_9BACT|nr:RsmD family RNA methyltransferase [Pseudobacteriovorax antillogorgiicola]TCS58594.1 16S rRNA (guanine(966)-N(2))-methyltransferase RsmD [Pseudobacteriovorax antillogorgiicola]SME97106.1 16S rRNA (guanine(966)-N(2))-methyltransferase RsmD [Pseudobacteriovorax antillogorgiicola]
MAIKLNSGWCRGLTLKSPPALHTRPTASRTREAVWNSLQFDLHNARVIDVFSGSGAIGFEALSRGCRSSLFIDQSLAAVKCLRENKALMETRALANQRHITMKIIQGDAVKVLTAQGSDAADILWIDPPYDQVVDLLPGLAKEAARVLVPGGKMIVECDQRGLPVIEDLRSLAIWSESKHKRYGRTFITIFERLGEE